MRKNEKSEKNEKNEKKSEKDLLIPINNPIKFKKDLLILIDIGCP